MHRSNWKVVLPVLNVARVLQNMTPYDPKVLSLWRTKVTYFEAIW